MKTVNAALSTAIRQGSTLSAKPRLIVDWNMNRYIGVTATNTPSDTTTNPDPDFFPISSIVEPVRPNAGINKARIGESIIAQDYKDNVEPRFYVASVDDKYKYWQAPNISDGTGAITGVAPQIVYDVSVSVNKIVIRFENSWSAPNAFTVQTSTNGTTFTNVSTSPAVGANGVTTLYWTGSAWSVTKPAVAVYTNIRGIKLLVTSLKGGCDFLGNPTQYFIKTQDPTGTETPNAVLSNTDGKNAHFSLIAIEAHNEVDFSDRVISTSDTQDMGETSQIYPIGTMTSNDGSVDLWNGDNLLNKDNTSSPYYQFIDANAEVNLSWEYTVAGTVYSVQQFKMFSDKWSGQKTDTVNLSLYDYSNYFQNTSTPALMYEDLTFPEIVVRILDSVGFTNHNIVKNTTVVDYTIPVWYTDGEKKVWEVLDELAQATQSAIYFDSFGVLQVKTRNAAFDTTRAVDWTLRGVQSGAELADIVDMSQSETYENNSIKISYQTTKWSEFNNGQPTMQAVYEPDDTVTMRASVLTTNMLTADMQFRMSAADAEIWPYSGIVNIEGEIIKYEGKLFVYYTNITTPVTVSVKSEDEYKKYAALTPPDLKYLNHFTGAFTVTERGSWNSQAFDHKIDTSSLYSTRYKTGTNSAAAAGVFVQKSNRSRVVLTSNSKIKKGNQYTYATTTDATNPGFVWYGMSFQFVAGSGYVEQKAGMVINSSGTTTENGYYIEFVPSAKLNGSARKVRNEVIVYSRVGNTKYVHGGTGNNGAKIAIATGIDYSVDVKFQDLGGTNGHRISVWVNGKKILTSNIPNAHKVTPNGKFGFFLNGRCSIQSEYLYAINRADGDLPDDFSFFDRVRGGFFGGAFEREWVYKYLTSSWRDKTTTSLKQTNWNGLFMDEFGPYVHEIREYNVKFDPAPVLHSRVFVTNDWQVICPEYRSNAFGASFFLANVSRQTAVINGDDSLDVENEGGDETVDQHFNVIGRCLVVDDSQEVTVKNVQQIRARGEIESEFSSTWIQSEDAAKALGNWISGHWAVGIDQQTANVFGNPMLELGDLVSVHYPQKAMTVLGNQYFVTGINTSWENGVVTQLTLRRKV